MQEVEPTTTLPIVGIGASAGGINALQTLFAAMPDDCGVAFVVVQHLPPGGGEGLRPLIAKWSAMPVHPAADGTRPEPNRIYIPSPDRILTIEHGVFRTRPSDGGNRRATIETIDAFLESLAEDRGSHGIAIILSGTGTDGTAGAICVRQAGGIVLVQDPVTALHDGMPNAVIAKGAADHVLAAGALPQQLIACLAPAYERPASAGWSGNVSETLDRILQFVRKQVGFDLTGYKPTPLLWRIQQRMDLRRVRAFEGYLSLLQDDPAELEALVRGIPIHVTEFFRDSQAWDVLADDVIAPLLQEATDGKPLRAWTPACSTGEEAYSLAMLLSEQAEVAGVPVDFQVFATDASAETLARAGHGVFSQKSVQSLSPERQARFLYAADGAFRVKRSLREKMVFAPQDVLADPPFSGLDLVTCRNLLIYLEPDAARRVLFLLHSSLRMGGYLFLGKGEPLSTRQKGFEPVSLRWHIYRKAGPISDIKVKFPSRLEGIRHETAVSANAHRAAIEHFDLPSVLIDDQFHILRVYGDTERVLRLPQGQPTLDLLDYARPGLAGRIQLAARRALSGRQPVTVSGLRDMERGDLSMSLRLTPLQTPEDGEPARLLVSFIRRTDRPASSPVPYDPAPQEWSEAVRISHEELEASREELQALNEELKTANEQLNLSNEDLNRANADLGSTIGEMEMQRRVLSSGAVMTLFLDEELNVRWFTPAVSELFPLRPQDSGRRITDFVQKFAYDDFVRDVGEVMRGREPREAEVRSLEGKWFLCRIRPYLSATETTTGVAVTFTDISARKRAEAALEVELADTQALHKISSSVIVEDNIDALYGQVLEAARSLMRSQMASIQRLAPDKGQLLLLAHHGFAPESARHWEWVKADATTSYGVALARGEPVVVPDVELWDLVQGTENLKYYRLSKVRAMLSTPLVSRDGRLVGVMSTHWREVHHPSERELRLLGVLARQAADLLERHAADEALRKSEQKYRTLFESIDEGLCIVEVIFDEHGRSIDYEFVEVNPVFEQQTGIRNAIGRRMREIAPEHETHWFDIYGRIALTGEPARFEYPARALGRFYDVYAFRVDEPERRRVAILFRDITGRKRAEQAQHDLRAGDVRSGATAGSPRSRG